MGYNGSSGTSVLPLVTTDPQAEVIQESRRALNVKIPILDGKEFVTCSYCCLAM